LTKKIALAQFRPCFLQVWLFLQVQDIFCSVRQLPSRCLAAAILDQVRPTAPNGLTQRLQIFSFQVLAVFALPLTGQTSFTGLHLVSLK